MNSKILLLLAMVSFSFLKAQRLFHSAGMNYDRYASVNGNTDALSFMYNSRLIFNSENKRFLYGLAAPISLGKIISSERERPKSMILELPLSAELSYKPYGIRNPLRNCGIFAGAGISRILVTDRFLKGSNYFNSYIGFRTSPLDGLWKRD